MNGARTVYVIHKTTRLPGDASYSGATWDRAGIRDRYREKYDSKREATALAAKLTECNPVGFEVTRVE